MLELVPFQTGVLSLWVTVVVGSDITNIITHGVLPMLRLGVRYLTSFISTTSV